MAKPPVDFNHYVPRGYQRSWQLADKQGWIGVYSRDGTYDPAPIKDNGGLDGFYDDELETRLGPIESEFGKAAKKIKNLEPISEKECGAVVHFMTTQLRRNLVGFRRTAANLQDVIKIQRPQHVQEFRAAVYSSDGSEGEKNTAWARLEKQIDEIYSRFEREGLSKDLFRETTLRHMDLLTSILKDVLTWTFFVSDGERHFVTSDNPVVMPREGLKNKPKVVFPVSPLVCLVARLPKPGQPRTVEYRPLGQKKVAGLNRVIIASASENVYASGQTVPVRELRKIGTNIWAERLAMTEGLRSAIEAKPWRGCN